MIKHLYFLLLITLVSCRSNQSIISKNVAIEVYTNEYEGKLIASAMPVIRSDSEIIKFKRRFEYILINVPEIHLAEKAEKRKEIWDLYPDTIELKRLYLKEYVQDKSLTDYFNVTHAAIFKRNFNIKTTYNIDELMEVASKFFYCDKVLPDTMIQTHVCIGLNGITEANWDKDYRLIEAFCFEAIFNDFDREISEIDESYSSNIERARLKFNPSIKALDLYLLEVRKELFDLMKNDDVLKQSLLMYYEQNKNNLSFRLIN